MGKVDIDWKNLAFGYQKTPLRYVANYKNGAWDKGGLTEDATVTISECAGILHYCQEIFEGLKEGCKEWQPKTLRWIRRTSRRIEE